MTENEIGNIVVDSAISGHLEPRPGLLASVYEVVLAHLLRERGIPRERQLPIPVEYRGIRFDEGFRRTSLLEAGLFLS